jgi:hypothetical protein
MTHVSFSKYQGSQTLKYVREGMDVFDSNKKRVGTIEDLYLGASSEKENAQGTGAATTPKRQWWDDSLVDDIVQAFAPEDEMPEVLRDRLLQHGYIRVNGPGLFAGDRYILPEQIASITEDHVYLNVVREDLIRPQVS